MTDNVCMILIMAFSLEKLRDDPDFTKLFAKKAVDIKKK